MKTNLIKIVFLFLVTSLCYPQNYSGYLNSNDQNAEIDILPTNPSKIGKVIREVKLKKILNEKESIITNHKITFYTTAYYKYTEKSRAAMGGKVGQKVGFRLTGISDQAFQEITDVTKEYLVKKLSESGYTFEDYNKFTSAKKYAKLKGKSSPSGVEYETQNLYLTKKVKAKTFTADKKLNHPPIVGNTLYYGILKEAKATIIISDFKINFLSIGHEVSHSDTMSEYITNYGIDLQECVYGSANLEFLTPKLKYGYLSSVNLYRYKNLLNYTFLEEKDEDGFYIVKVNEQEYKTNVIALVNDYIDLMFVQMDAVASK